MPKFVVLKAFPYKGRRYEVGSEIEIDEDHVSLLTVLGNVRKPGKDKLAYKRRDMRPEGK